VLYGAQGMWRQSIIGTFGPDSIVADQAMQMIEYNGLLLEHLHNFVMFPIETCGWGSSAATRSIEFWQVEKER